MEEREVHHQGARGDVVDCGKDLELCACLCLCDQFYPVRIIIMCIYT